MKRTCIVLLMLVCAFPLLAGARAEPKESAAAVTAVAGPVGPEPRQYNLDDYGARFGVRITSFKEAPMLAERVRKGELPPVEQRLPRNPIVMDVWDEIGRYGGVLRYNETNQSYCGYLRHLTDVQLLELAPSNAFHRYNFVGGEILPGVFDEWSMSSDGKVVTLHIREGLKWSDGKPVTTADVRYTIEDVLKNTDVYPVPDKWINWGGSPMKLVIIDDLTFRLEFAASNGLFLYELTHRRWHTLMRPRHYLEQFHRKYAKPADLAKLMEKEGYKTEEWGRFYSFIDPSQMDGGSLLRVPYVQNYPTLDPWVVTATPNPEEIVLHRNPYYFKIDRQGNQLPYLDGLHRYLVTNLEVQNMKIISGETDMQFQYTKLSDLPLLMKNKDVGGYEVMALKCWQDQMLIYVFNLCPDDPILKSIVQDKRFRQALSLALDREEMQDSIFLGFGRPAQVAPAPGSPFWNDQVDYEQSYAQYDVARANQLLDEMGLKWDRNREYRLRSDGQRVTLPFMYYEVTPPAAAGAELASSYWKAIGIDAPVKMVDGGLFWQRQAANEPFVTNWWLAGRWIINQYGFGYSGFLLTSRWWRWYNTDGKEGEEPTPEAQELYRLRDTILSTPSEEERIRAGREVFRSQAENVWLIGTVVETPTPFIYSKKLGNVAATERYGYYTISAGEAAEQWFFK